MIVNSGFKRAYWLRLATFVAILLTSVLVHAAQPSAQEPNSCVFNHYADRYAKAKDEHQRARELSWMFEIDALSTFPYVVESLIDGPDAVKVQAAQLIGSYYVEIPRSPGDEELKAVAWPENIRGKGQTVTDLLRKAASSDIIELRLNALQSLARMGELDSILVASLCAIALGENRQQWHMSSDIDTNRPSEVVEKQRGLRSNAFGLLYFLRYSGIYRDLIIDTIGKALADPDKATELKEFDRFIKLILGMPETKSEEEGVLRSSPSGDCWIPFNAEYYCHRFREGRNNDGRQNECTPYKNYVNLDCANFVSQCLIAGSLDLSGGVRDPCRCIHNCDNLNAYLSSRADVDTTVRVGLMDPNLFYNRPNATIPALFTIGDIAILGDDLDHYRHAVICDSIDGGSYYFSGHGNTDDVNRWIRYWELDRVTYYHILPSSCPPKHASWGQIKGAFTYGYTAGRESMRALASHSNTIVWNDFDPASPTYSVFRSLDGADRFDQIGSTVNRDTVFVDNDIAAGHTYQYRLATMKGDTIIDSNESSSGFKTISELIFPGEGGCVAMAIDGQYLYAALGAYPAVIKKIDISNPLSPLEVGSRIINDKIREFGIGYYGGYLFCIGDHSFYVIDKQYHNLPITGQLNGLAPGATSYCWDMALKGNVAYVACGTDGIVAVSFYYPDNPQIWDTYTGTGNPGNRYYYGVESVGNYLYVFGGITAVTSLSEIIDPFVDEGQHHVYFNLACSNIEEPLCLDPSIDLARISSGRPKGYYSVGTINDTLYAVYNTVSPIDPALLKVFNAPAWLSIWDDPYSTYEFDDQYLYVASGGYTQTFGRRVYAFNIYSPDTIPDYATGDTVGAVSESKMASWGRYLYLCDRFCYYGGEPWDQVTRLRVFEKARACNSDISVSTQLSPDASVYEVGRQATISWTCFGCPIRGNIQLIEDGFTSVALASFSKLDYPNIGSGSFVWTVNGMSSDHENHSYAAKVLVWNIEGNYAETESRSFRIVDHIEVAKPGVHPVIEDVSSGEARSPFALPGFARDHGSSVRDNFWVLPNSFGGKDGTLSLRVRGCEGKDLIMRSIELVSVDVARGITVTRHNGELQLTRDGEQFLPIGSYIDGSAEPEEFLKNIILAIERIKRHGSGSYPLVDARGGVVVDFSVPHGRKDSRRFYLLALQGTLIDSKDESSRAIPEVFALNDPYPNPFNPVTTVVFDVPATAQIVIKVYSSSGMTVRTLIDGECNAGTHRVTWDGTNTEGNKVSSGVYFCRMTVNGGMKLSKKLVLLK